MTWIPWPDSYTIGTLPSGDTRTILIRGIVDPLATGTIFNTTSVTSTTPDPNPGNNSSTAITPITTLADVAVTKTGSPDPIAPGDMINYTIDVINFGPSAARDVTLNDVVPSTILGAEYSTDGGTTWLPWTGSYDIGIMGSGEIRPILIRGTVDPLAPSGPITNTANITFTTSDPNPGNNSSTITTDVNALTDLSVIKIASPNPVNAGDILNYTVDVSNFGPGDAQNVVLTDAVPPQLLGAEYSTDGGITWLPWTGSYDIGTLPSGTSITVLIRGTVDPLAPSGPIFNTATVNSSTPDSNPDNNTSTVITDVNAIPADLSVVKTGTPNPINAGDMINYTIDVANAGPGDAQNVVLTDAVSPQLLGAEYSTDGGITWLPWTGSYDIGTLPGGASTTVLIRGTVDPSTPSGFIFNTANVTSTTPDPNPDNNTSTVITEVNAIPADLSVVKTASPIPVNAGEMLTYTVDVSNAGPGNAQDVVLNDAIPPQLLGAEYSIDGGVTWNPWTGSYNVGTLPVGATTTVLIRGKIDPSTPPGPIINTANVTSSTPDPNPDNNSYTIVTDVNALADVSIIKTGNPNPVIPGQILNYTIDATNFGPSDSQDVMVNDIIPPQVLGAEYSTDGGVTWLPWTGNYNIGTLPAGASNTILIRGTVDPSATGTIFNTANVTSTTPDPNPSNNTSTIITTIATGESADVSVTKSASPNPVMQRRTLVYTINVSNAGPSDAQSVVLTDDIPSRILRPQFSTDGGATWSPWTGSYNIATLPAGASRTILIRGTVCVSAEGTISNTANVTSTTPDPNPSNNTSTVNTFICNYPKKCFCCKNKGCKYYKNMIYNLNIIKCPSIPAKGFKSLKTPY
ncbi:DUF11 domain-containing protein [Proteiniborus sp. MB09-C3]|nr:DUF11 domain-containing protein [Proteiniborus sp. MB09-C3]WIV13898.1 DUF11 domain-containing protein [Proteiniborus sp. MB09-C3]